jgi:hypothetical protein
LPAYCPRLHFYGWNRGGKKAYLASEPIHHLPVLQQLYDLSEARFFDIYEQGVKFLAWLSKFLLNLLTGRLILFMKKSWSVSGVFLRSCSRKPIMASMPTT